MEGMAFARVLLVPVIVLVALAGCAGRDLPAAQPTESSPAAVATSAVPTPTPTPTPTPDDATLTAVGLGDLEIGKPVPDDTGLLEWGDFCGYGTEQWHAPGATLADLGPIGVTPIDWEKDGDLRAIWIWTDEISTPEGIHNGSTREELEAAYPEAEIVAQPARTDLYVVENDETNLVFEVLKPGSETNDGFYTVDTVAWMYLLPSSAELKTIDGTGAPASCD
jgi:hypothetical protein